MRPSRILFRKQTRDIFRQIKQYIAVILIAALAVALFAGLAANFRILEKRINTLYTDSNMSDIFLTTTFGQNEAKEFVGISNKDFNKIRDIKINKKGDLLNNHADFERRTLFPVNLFASPSDTSDTTSGSVLGVSSKGIDASYNIILNDKGNSLNKMTTIYDEKEKIIENGFDSAGIDGIFLPRTAGSTIKIGENISVRFPQSFFVKSLEDELGITLERDSENKTLATGKILKEDKTYLKLNELLTFLGININENMKQLLSGYNIEELLSSDISKELVYNIEQKITDNQIAGNTPEEREKNKLITANNYLKFLTNFANPTAFISFDMKLLGYVDHPESIEKTSSNPYAFANRDVFFNHFLRALKNNFKTEISLVNMFMSSFDDVKYPKASYIDEMSKYFSDDFFASEGFYGKLSKIKTVIPEDSMEDIISSDSLLLNIKDKFNINNLYNQLLIKMRKSAKGYSISDIQHEINKIYNPEPLELRNENEPAIILNQQKSELYSNLIIENDLKQSKQLMAVFPVIFFLVAVLIIVATQLQLIFKERTQIGTLKALGFYDREIYGHYISKTFFVTLIGVLIGVIAGPLALPIVMGNKYKLLYNLPKQVFVFPYLEVGLLLVAFFSIVTLIVFLVCRKEVSYLPAISMRPKDININFKTTNKKLKAKNIPSKMAFRNIRVNMFRTLMTIIGVMGCVALFIGGMGISDTIKRGIDHDIGMYYECDVAIGYALGENAKDDIIKVEGIDPNSVEEYYSQPVTIKHSKTGKTSQTMAYGFYSNSMYYNPPEKIKPEIGEIILSTKTADNIKAKKGDNITFRTLNNVEYHFKIKAITDAFFVQGITFLLDDHIYAPNLEHETAMAYANVLPGYDVEELAEILRDKDKFPTISQVITTKSVENIIRNVTTTIDLATSTILIFAILLAFAVLYNLARLNLDIRRREIATLKVLGFSAFEITESLIIETLFLTAIGAILGGLLGFPILYLILKINETAIISFMYHITWQTYVIGIFSAFLLASIINLLLANNANKTPMVESLKSVE